MNSRQKPWSCPILCAFFGAVLCFFFSAVGSADQYRLTFQMVDGSCQLLHSELQPGRAKIPRNDRIFSEHYCVGTTLKGEALFAAEIHVPRGLYHDAPDHLGTLSGGMLPLEEPVFSVSVPAGEELRWLSLYRQSEPDQLEYLSLRSQSQVAVPKGEIFARFDVEKLPSPSLQRVPLGETHKLRDFGDDSNRVVWVFLGDGYRVEELPKYLQDVENVLEFAMTQEPWREYQSYVNVYAIEVISNESGADHPSLGIYRDTALGATYDLGGIRRALYCTETQAVFRVADRIPGRDAIFIVVNDTEYGGTGGPYSTFSVHPLGADIAVHETGHSFVGLADEYDGDQSGGNAAEPNIESKTTLASIKWNMWILPDTPIPTPDESLYNGLIGLFEGAKYQMTGLFRPKRNCKMRELEVPFCEVCQETHLVGNYKQSVYKLLNIIEGSTPDVSHFEVTIGETSSLAFALDTLQNESQTVKARWYLDGIEQVGVSGTQISISGSQLTQGDHWLYVVVRDRTDMIRNDPQNYRWEDHYWTFTVNFVSSISPRIWQSY